MFRYCNKQQKISFYIIKYHETLTLKASVTTAADDTFFSFFFFFVHIKSVNTIFFSKNKELECRLLQSLQGALSVKRHLEVLPWNEINKYVNISKIK